MTHYDALGVDQHATPEEIKKAYRRKSAKNHPDRKGGDSRAMVAINKAYECLSNPAKREYYDLHGEEAKLSSIEQQAFAIIYGILAQLIAQGDEGDFVTAVKANLENNLRGLKHKRPELEKQISKIERQRKCIRRKQKDQENLLDRIFQQHIDALKAKIDELPEALELGKRALEIMVDYENAFEGGYPAAQRYSGGSLSGFLNDEMARALFGGRR